MLVLCELGVLLDLKGIRVFTWKLKIEKKEIFSMNLATFHAEEYPIVVQVIKGYLSLYQPDFDYRVMEPYRPNDVGQTEMLIMKMRRELTSKANLIADAAGIPSPSKSKAPEVIDLVTLSTKDVGRLLGVCAMTVVRLADDGSLPCKKTPKGHRRFKRSDVEKLLSKDHIPTLSTGKSNLHSSGAKEISTSTTPNLRTTLPDIDQ